MVRSRSCALLVLNHNGRDLLEQYLPSVLKAAGPARVVVVDNASTDSGPDLAERMGAEVLRRGCNDFLMGLNHAACLIPADVLVMLNNDLEVAPDFLPPLLQHFEDSSVCSVGCKIMDPDRVRVQMARTLGRFCQGLLEPVYMIEQLLEPEGSQALPTLYTPGGACAVDRLKFLELGGFHPLMHPIYSEDVDLGYSAWRRGWRNLYEPRSVVVHQHAATTSRMFTREWLDRNQLKNKLMVTLKNVSDGRILRQFARSCAWIARQGLRTRQNWKARAILQMLGQMPGVCRYRSTLPLRGVIPDRCICNLQGEPADQTLVGFQPR